jgi:hypothetical protein
VARVDRAVQLIASEAHNASPWVKVNVRFLMNPY